MKSFKDFLLERKQLSSVQRHKKASAARRQKYALSRDRNISKRSAATAAVKAKRAATNAQNAMIKTVSGKAKKDINPSARANVSKRVISMGSQTAAATRRNLPKVHNFQAKRLSTGSGK